MVVAVPALLSRYSRASPLDVAEMKAFEAWAYATKNHKLSWQLWFEWLARARKDTTK